MKQINIIGTGLMGRQIASFFYLNGYKVKCYYFNSSKKEVIEKNIKLLKRKLNLDNEGELTMVNSFSALYDAPTIETAIEDLIIKKKIFHEVKKVNSNEVYFSNTSSFSPKDISPEVNGLHFYNPIFLGLVELYLTESVDRDQITPFIELLKGNNFEVVEVNSNRGYIGNYVLFNEIASAFKLLEKYNYTLNAIDAIYSKLYGGRKLFAIVDLIGVDVSYNILQNLKEQDETIYLPLSLKKALDKNILGKKNGTSIKTILNES